jgi:parvulin-like peptidyl-prolyl isomerase
MISGFREEVPVEEPKERAKWLWLGVIVLFCLMVLALWRWGRMNPPDSVVRARHILISFDSTNPADRARAFDLATDLRERILEGESFATLAKRYSNDEQSAARGGDLGFSTQGSFVGGVEEFAWNAPIGEVSDIIQTQYGFHIVVVEERIISEIDRAAMEEERRLKELRPE